MLVTSVQLNSYGGSGMKALMVYDTKHGMTEQVAKAIMNGMKEAILQR